ncbi:bifunctional nuclease 2 isoform X1 [Quercus robur]|uniref:bifunctional nuclease 2 isoform X1 n=1 Tax=Quercus robur TaxID=38942 RepID=UPI00216208BD|nr:bifunctional nuclease 2 isoform X1 [Quercus robur]XP_050241640.1 bifunctional nuclease 2 isoform X1 [Quercus robur]
MLGARVCVRTVAGFGSTTTFSDQTRSSSSSSCSSWAPKPNALCLSSPFRFGNKRRRNNNSSQIQIQSKSQSMLIVSRNSSRGRFGGRSGNAHDRNDHDFLEASILLSETALHYRMRRQGYREERKWPSPGQSTPFSVQLKKPRVNVDLIGESFLRRFQNPTIFLKISCDGDFLLPIIVGEFAVEKLIDPQWEDKNGDSPDQFNFIRDLVEKLGYQVTMVRITERVVNTYFARLYFSKPGKNDILSVDARPSDAINVANRCKAPIFVSRQIVLEDAIKIGYGMGRTRDTKSTYDVSLDSAADGPDILSEELYLVKNMNFAIREERYKDAAMWRDKLVKLRESST